MPVFLAEIPEVYTRISRPIIKQVVNDVLGRFKDIPFREFRMLGEQEQLQTPGSGFDMGGFNRSHSDNYVDVEVDDQADDNYGNSYIVGNDINHNIMSCKKTLLDFYPVYKNRKVIISLKIVCSSRVRLNGLITRIKQGMDHNQTLFTHQISYDYDLPVACTELLNQVYHLMENKYGYNISFLDWLKEIKQSQVEMFTRLDGEVGVLGVRENAVNVLSNLVEHEQEPRKDNGDGKGIQSIELEIELKYQRPNQIRASYPPIVHNQFLPEIWFNKMKTYDYRDNFAQTAIAEQAMEHFKWNLGFSDPRTGKYGVKEPEFDDWGKDILNNSLQKLVTCLVTIDEGDRRNFFNLEHDLIDHKLPPVILAAIKKHPFALLHDGKHILHVRAYKGNEPIRPEHLLIDDDLNIRLDYDANPREYYHLVLCLNRDPSTIPDKVWETILCDKEAIILYFSYFGKRYEDKIKEIIATIDDDVCLTPSIIDDVIDKIIDDGGNIRDDVFDTERQDRRTKLRFSVHGVK